MKKLISCIMLAAVATATAANISFVWDYLNPPPDFAGFRLYSGTAGQTNILSSLVRLGPSGTVSNLTAGKYRFWATAFTTNNVESDPSNIVLASIPAPVTGLRVLSGGSGALTFTWATNSEADLSGYLFTYGNEGSTNATATLQVSTNRATIAAARDSGTFWAYAVAVTTNNIRGDPSMMVIASLPAAPGNLRIGP